MGSILCVLGFDYGQKRIGVAVGQTITKTANPLTTLSANQGTPDWNAIQALIQKWQPNACVVGIPYNPEGSPTTQQQAQHFANQLEQHSQLPVIRVDEHLSSVSARERLREQNIVPDRTNVNAMAAAIILESWLQEANNKEDSP